MKDIMKRRIKRIKENKGMKRKVRTFQLAAGMLVVFAFLFIFNLPFSGAETYSFVSSGSSASITNTQYFQPGIRTYYTSEQIGQYWPILSNRSQCRAGADLMIQIAPGGCTPAVVRSDLLEEQNVPVFCRLQSIKLNPSIDVSSIQGMSFSVVANTDQKNSIAGFGFHPARAALRTTTGKLLGSPVVNDIGYVVVLLKRNEIEKNMSDWVEANLTARIRYNTEKAFGIGKAESYLPVMTDEEWGRDYISSGFWSGKGYLRAEWIEPDKAAVSVYIDKDTKVSNVILEIGKKSDVLYLPSTSVRDYCRRGLELTLQDITYPQIRAVISIDNPVSGQDRLELYKGASFLNGKCYVNSIKHYGDGAGEVMIRCPRETFRLVLGVKSVKLNVDGEEKGYNIGDEVANANDASSRKLYVTYVGKLPASVKVGGIAPSESERTFVVLADSTKTGSDASKAIESIRSQTASYVKSSKETTYIEFNTKIEDIAKKYLNAGDNAWILLNKEGSNVMRFGDEDKEIYFTGSVSPQDRDYSGEGDEGIKFEEYFKRTIDAYREVAVQFPGEIKDTATQQAYGEAALIEAINFAKESEKFKTAKDLQNEFLERYPNAEYAKTAREELSNSEFYDDKNATHFTEIDFETYGIRLAGISEPNIDDANAEITWKDNREGSVNSNVKYAIGSYIVNKPQRDCGTNIKIDETINLTKMDESKITLRATYCSTTTGTKNNEPVYSYSPVVNKEFVIEAGASQTIGDYDISVNAINLKRVAHVLLNPQTFGDEIQSNFSFKIGIEKRAVQLSPEKTAEMIKKLNETIEKWQDLNKKLGNVVEGMKGACFATSAVLTIKNLFSGFSGEAIARQKVMRNPGGWIDRCTELQANGGPTIDECLRQNSDIIDGDVKKMTSLIQEQNKKIKEIESDADITKSTFFGKSVNTEKSAERYITDLQSSLESSGVITLKDENNNPIDIDMGKIVKDLSWTAGDAGYDQLRAIELYNTIRQDSAASPTAREMAERELYSTLKSVEERQNARTASSDLKSKWGIPFGVYSNKDAFAGVYEGGVLNKGLSDAGISEDIDKTAVQGIVYNNEKYVAVLELASGKQYSVKDFYKLNARGNYEKVTDTREKGVLNTRFSSFEKYDETKYQNPYKNAQARFYETEPYKGMPAVVPLDVKDGWYAATKQTLPAFGNVKPFEESGKVSSFWLCNVGANGLEQFSQGIGIGDDICGMFNLNTGQPLDQFAGLSREKTQELVNKAIESLRQATSQYPSKTIRIPAGTFQVGAPATNAPGTQCQDFMSPKDCWIMFNVCDPVVCPTSRCDLGGAYPVDDVIQSGIVGSIALCLPNIRERIFVPVCLTGVHAGIEGWVSILEARRDCLQESLNTGKTIGICDQINSIYTCDFFWRQFAPFMNIIPKKITEWMYGQGTKGGGEYLTVSEAWNNAEKSWQYFTTFYAQNSKMSFAARSFADIGTEFCKMGISTKYPKGFKGIFEPESPPQIHAWFDEITYTEATYPATSQYKVYYHIFSGQDIGAYYSVYLKSIAATSYYQQIPFITVDSGFIPAGETIDITKDFTAPAGYKELCVRVNAKDYCGFKQVSTSFALNYVKDKYLNEQASQQISSEKECISGTPSLYAFAQPSLQAGAEEALNPEIYNRGIIRICASKNPGETTDSGRWKDVGYCDDENIRCWLDSDSVKDNIRNKEILNETIKEIEDKNIDNLLKQGFYDDKEGKAELERLDKYLLDLKKKTDKFGRGADISQLSSIESDAERLIAGIDSVNEKLIYSNQKAWALYMKAQVYYNAARAYKTAVEVVIEERIAEAKKKTEKKEEKKTKIEAGKGETLYKAFVIVDKEEIKVFIDDKKSFYFKTTKREYLSLNGFKYNDANFYYNGQNGEWYVKLLGLGDGSEIQRVSYVKTYQKASRELREIASLFSVKEEKNEEPESDGEKLKLNEDFILQPEGATHFVKIGEKTDYYKKDKEDIKFWNSENGIWEVAFELPEKAGEIAIYEETIEPSKKEEVKEEIPNLDKDDDMIVTITLPLNEEEGFIFKEKEYKIELAELSVKPAKFLGIFNLGSFTNIKVNVGDKKTLTKSISGGGKTEDVEEDIVNWNYNKIGKDRVDLDNAEDKKKDILISITHISFVDKNIEVTIENINPAEPHVTTTKIE